MNEHIKDLESLRGLGGVKTIVSYTDIVVNVHTAIKDLCDENKNDYMTNLCLFLEGLGDDVTELENGRELRHIPVRPKSQQDVEDIY